MYKMKRRRDKAEIIEEILQETINWKSKTYIISRANMNPFNNKYLNALVKTGYLKEKKNLYGYPKYQYKITKEGLELLKLLKEVSMKLEKVKIFL